MSTAPTAARRDGWRKNVASSIVSTGGGSADVVDWIVLLSGSLVCGAGIVAAMSSPRGVSTLSILLSAGGLTVALSTMGAIYARYASFQSMLAAGFFLLAGVAIGYRIAAAALLHLARDTVPTWPPEPGAVDAHLVVLLAWSEPERYSVGWVARRHRRLTEGAGVEMPVAAVPLVFMAVKTRYRVSGGRSPGVAAARDLAERVSDRLADRADRSTPDQSGSHEPSGSTRARVIVAAAADAGSLSDAIARNMSDGAARVTVVPLGHEDSDEVDGAKHTLQATQPVWAQGLVRFAPGLWNDTALAGRLAERILASAQCAERHDVGVVLVSPGTPAEWERQHPDAREEENYFNQRVRMHLCSAGIDERAARIAWLDWRTPDVTEAVRHVAALGRSHIVVAPSTIVLPSLETTVDLRHAVDGARVPESVTVVTLPCWADDDGLVEAIVRTVEAARC